MAPSVHRCAQTADCFFLILIWPLITSLGIVPSWDTLSVAFEWASARAYGWGACCSPWPPSCLQPLVSRRAFGLASLSLHVSFPLPCPSHLSLSPHLPPITPHTPTGQTAAILARAGPRPPRMPTTAGNPTPAL